MAGPNFGIRLTLVQGPLGAGWEEIAQSAALARVSQRAEELGYAFVAAGEHLAVPTEEAAWLGRWVDPYAALSYVAAVTHKIELVLGVAVLPYRHPLLTAKLVASLDWLSSGRFILGIGAGYLEREFAALGVEFKHRGAMTDDYLAAVRAVLSTPTASHTGTYAGFEQFTSNPFPAAGANFPIWVGGSSHAAIRRAATAGDGWILPVASLPTIRDGLSFASTLQAFQERSRPFAVCVSLLPLGGGSDVGSPARRSDRPSPPRAERAIAEIEDYVGAGVTHFRVHFVAGSEEEFLDALAWFASDVMARVPPRGAS
jgi:probable F420-dependent oxidoreductase